MSYHKNITRLILIHVFSNAQFHLVIYTMSYKERASSMPETVV